MYDRSDTGHRDSSSHVPGPWTHRDDPRGLVQSWTDNPITEQHREERHRREFIWTFDTYQLIEITRGDYNWFRFTVLWRVPDCMRKQMGHTGGYEVICRTKCISIARGRGDSIERGDRGRLRWSEATGSAHDSSNTTAGFYRTSRKYRSRRIVPSCIASPDPVPWKIRSACPIRYLTRGPRTFYTDCVNHYSYLNS